MLGALTSTLKLSLDIATLASFTLIVRGEFLM